MLYLFITISNFHTEYSMLYLFITMSDFHTLEYMDNLDDRLYISKEA